MIYRGFAALLAIFTLAVATITFALLELMFWNFGSVILGTGKVFAIIPAAVTFAALFKANSLIKRDLRQRIEVQHSSGRITILRLSRLSGPAWLNVFDANPDWPTFLRVAVNILLLAPRLFDLTLRTWRHARQLGELPLENVGDVLEQLIKAGGKVPLITLMEQYPDLHPQIFLNQLLLFDGIALLPHETPGIAVVPSLIEEFEEWRKARRKQDSLLD